jgi:hypothetical protein
MVAEITKQMPSAFFSAPVDESRSALGGRPHTEQRVHAIYRAPRDASRVISKPHPRHCRLPLETLRLCGSREFVTALLV